MARFARHPRHYAIGPRYFIVAIVFAASFSNHGDSNLFVESGLYGHVGIRNSSLQA
jgi:hypothetical protein